MVPCHQTTMYAKSPNTFDRNLSFAVPTLGSLGASVYGKVLDGVAGERGGGLGSPWEGEFMLVAVDLQP